ncbi:MAG: metallophosphoesterase [Candidatus Nanohaloarchaea archaeon]|nr:metallophosphoesterase [Candidatus Nanohaloarchaea archaeon]
MRVLLTTDIHGNVSNLESVLDRADYDVALCAGDLSDAGEYSDYEDRLLQVLDAFDDQRKLSKAVPGNMDQEEACVRNLIDRRMNLHKNVASFDRFDAIGFGGGLTPFGTPFEPDEEEIRSVLAQLYDRMQADNRVAVIHQPPAATSTDVADGEHVGSKEVRKLIEENDLDLVLTGHIHESRSMDELAGTTLVNPGPVADGYYAVAAIDDGIDVQLKEL